MDLYLFKDDFNEVFREIRDQFFMAPEYDGGTLFSYKWGSLKKGKMEYGLGDYDTALFYHHHPYDSDDFNMFSVRSLYEQMVLIKKNKVPAEDFIYQQFKNGKEAINIGKMIEGRESRNEAIRMREFEKNSLQHPDKNSLENPGAAISKETKHNIRLKKRNNSLLKSRKIKRRPKL